MDMIIRHSVMARRQCLAITTVDNNPPLRQFIQITTGHPIIRPAVDHDRRPAKILKRASGNQIPRPADHPHRPPARSGELNPLYNHMV